MKKQWVLGALSIAALVMIIAIIGVRNAWAGVPAGTTARSFRAPAATLIVTNTADIGAGTLRQALLDAVGGDTITFDTSVFPPTRPVTIVLISGPLPDITQGNLTIDASNAGVIIDGSSVSDGDGLRITSDGNTIKGLQIIRFPGNGVEIADGAQHNTIGGDWTMGSALHGEGNIITLNKGNGIDIIAGMTNTVSGNLIGLDSNGTQELFIRDAVMSPAYASDGTVFLSTKTHGVVRTTDRGNTWSQINTGLPVSDVQTIAISPDYANDRTVLAHTGKQLFRSTDGGDNWILLVDEFGESGLRFYFSPNCAVDHTVFTSHGFGKSTDGGATWQFGSSGLPSQVRTLALSPNYAADQTLFAAVTSNGVYKSVDGGASWTAANNGLNPTDLGNIVLSRNYANDQTLFTSSDCQNLHRSVDGGRSWTTNHVNVCIQNLWISPNYTADHTLFNTHGERAPGGGGLAKSTDDGITWMPNFATGLPESLGWSAVLLLSPDYGNDQTLFIVTDRVGAHRSVDGGENWTHVTGALSELGNYGSGVNIQGWSGTRVGNIIGGTTPGKRNVISHNGGAGVNIEGADTSGNTVQGNYIGTDTSGTVGVGNAHSGVNVGNGAQQNVIGGTTSSERNILSGNASGISFNSTDTMSNTVSGNYIGTDVNGTAAIGNNASGNSGGVRFEGGASHNTVGGTTIGERNVICGNESVGIEIRGAGTSDNRVVGNYIGVDASGTTALGNGNGIGISGERNTIGGATSAERNIISANRWDGIQFWGTDAMSNTIVGNYIGTDATGTLPLGNGRDGVRMETGARYNVVGGDSPDERNVVSGNSLSGVSMGGGATENVVVGNYIGTDASGMTSVGNGQAGNQAGVAIYGGATRNRIERNVISGNNVIGVSIDWGLDSDNNVVIGNYIGTDATGTGALGNTFAGIFIADNASDNIIGGSTAAEENIIAYNGTFGVFIRDTATIRNTITYNSIHSNADIGIELSEGGNTELDAPIITYLDLDAGTVTGMACPGCTVEVFSDSNDEGEAYEGQTKADIAGTFTFNKGSPLAGPHLNATATDAAGNTSEFSVGMRQTTPLSLGNPLEDSVEPLGYSDYMLEIDAGERLLVEVTPLSGVGHIRLYGRLDHVPSQAHYDFQATERTVRGTYELLVAPTRLGTYYFSVFGWDIAAEQGTYTIVARTVDQYLSDVQPRSAGNTGDVTLNVQGLGFVEGTSVELRRAGSPTLVADDVVQLSSTAMSVRFDLTGVDPGIYDVVAIWSGGTEEKLEEAFEVLTGGVGPRLEASLEVPDFVRPGRTFTLWLDYANTGDAEMVAPLFIISSTQGVPMRLTDQEPFEDRPVQVLGVNPEGLAGNLAPDASGRIPIYLHIPADTGSHVMLDFGLAIMISDTLPIDWDEVEDEVRPPDVNPEVWNVLWPNLTAQIGDTWGDYRQALADNASYLSSLAVCRRGSSVGFPPTMFHTICQ